MGKPNNNQKRGNNKPSYFKENVQRFGIEFLKTRNAFDLERDARKIIRDIVYGNIDYATEGQFFYDTNLLYAVKKCAYTEWLNANYNYNGNIMLQQYNSDEALNSLTTYNMKRRDAYAFICAKLDSFSADGNLGWLEQIPVQLARYKSNI